MFKSLHTFLDAHLTTHTQQLHVYINVAQGQLEQSQAEKDEDQLIMERLLLGSRLSLRVEEEEALRSNCILSALLEQEVEETPLASVEEVRSKNAPDTLSH